ncbi:MAG: hypothetical protein LC792_03575 [Actinobacteria bacterium]|nr:hypothetical protein [Actinomycetota bacterium]
MRKLPAAIAGLTIAVTLSSPAWAATDTVQHRHHHFSGQSDGGGNSRYDERHPADDDGSILF